MRGCPSYHRRRASTYIYVVGTTMIVSLAGLSTVSVLRSQNSNANDLSNRVRAEYGARSMVDWARQRIEADTSWRTNRSNGIWFNQTINSQVLRATVTDPADANLADDPLESVLIEGYAKVGNAQQVVRVRLVTQVQPIDALKCSMHAHSNLAIGLGKVFSTDFGPISTNAVFTNLGTCYGNVECNTSLNLGSVNGTITTGATTKDKPDSTVMSTYQGWATTVAFYGDLDRRLICPTSNPWNVTQTDGLFYLNTNGSDIVIKKCRIVGTLVIDCGSARDVRIEEEVFWQPARADYPALITNGHVRFKGHQGILLSEGSAGVNFNPAAAPYNGATDNDTFDVFPNEVRGLVHTTGELDIENNCRVLGCLVSEGSPTMNIDSTSTVYYDTTLTTNPPLGYRKYQMRVDPGSWQRGNAP